MAKSKDEALESEGEVLAPPVVEATNTDEILLITYFERYRQEIHPYTRAFILPEYRGIIKSKDEWDKELTGKL